MSKSMAENFAHLLELIDQQSAVIQQQNSIIAKLLNENVEKESYIQMALNE